MTIQSSMQYCYSRSINYSQPSDHQPSHSAYTTNHWNQVIANTKLQSLNPINNISSAKLQFVHCLAYLQALINP